MSGRVRPLQAALLELALSSCTLGSLCGEYGVRMTKAPQSPLVTVREWQHTLNGISALPPTTAQVTLSSRGLCPVIILSNSVKPFITPAFLPPGRTCSNTEVISLRWEKHPFSSGTSSPSSQAPSLLPTPFLTPSSSPSPSLSLSHQRKVCEHLLCLGELQQTTY